MAELAMAALGALGGGGAAAGATAGTAAAAGSAAAGSGILTALQGIATVVGIIGTIGAGNAAATQSEISAVTTDMEAGQERVVSTQRQTEMKRTLLQVLGDNDVAFARAGIDISSGAGGIAAGARRDAETRATSELSIERSDDEFRRAMLKVRSDSLRNKAKSQRGGALLTAIGQGLDFGIDLTARG